MAILASSWMFVGTGWVIAAAGVGVLASALFRDRSRGRRRCPRCWYDMSGAPGLTCPECGRAVKSERGLLRTRRSWKRAAYGCVLVAVGVLAARLPEYRQGWERLIPSTALAALAHPADESVGTIPLVSYARGMLGGGSLPVQPRPPTFTVQERITNEAWRRMREGAMWDWQSRWFMSRCLRSADVKLAGVLKLPAVWPVGEPLRGDLTWPSFPGSGQVTLEVRSPDLNGPWQTSTDSFTAARSRVAWLREPTHSADHIDAELLLRLGGREIYRTSASFPTRVSPSREAMLDRVGSAQADDAVRASLRPRLIRDEKGRWAVDYAGSGRTPIDFGVDFRVEVVAGTETIGRAVGMAPTGLHRSLVIWEEGGRERLESALAAASPDVRLRITGAPDRAALSFINDPFNAQLSKCWSGSFEVPIPPPGS